MKLGESGLARSDLFRIPAFAIGVLVAIFIMCASPASAQSVRYIYDELGRLVGVVDQNGNSATYNYDAVGNLLSITTQTASQVAVINFSPDSGTVGTQVTINGSGFSANAAQDSVSFNGTAAAITSATTTQIVATVPSGATNGPISVTAPNGTASSSSSFIVTGGGAPAPTITGFSPTIGAPGTQVTISGTNFQTNISDDDVAFNAREGDVSTASTTSITAIVPENGTSGPLDVETPFGEAVSSGIFYITPPGVTVASEAYEGQTTIGGSAVNISLSSTNKHTLLTFNGTAGHAVSVLFSNSTFGCCPTVNIYNPDTTVLFSNNENG